MSTDNDDQIKDPMDLLELAIKRMDDKLKKLDDPKVSKINMKF